MFHLVIPQEIRTAQTFAAFPVHYRIHLYVAAAFCEAEKVTQDDIVSKVPMFNILKSRPEDQRHVIAAFELLCQASILRLKRNLSIKISTFSIFCYQAKKIRLVSDKNLINHRDKDIGNVLGAV